LRYTNPGGKQTIKTLRSRAREVAEPCHPKAQLIKEEACLIRLKGVEKSAKEERGGRGKKLTDDDI